MPSETNRQRRLRGVRLPPFHRRYPAAVAIVAGLGVLALLGRGTGNPRDASAAGDDRQRFHDRIFVVVKVVDGDTIDVRVPGGHGRATRVRLWGVDTPEVAGAPTGAMYWGDRASAFAKRTLLGRRVRLELLPDRTRDKYRRLLAYVYVAADGRLFNEMLIDEGHAYADTRFDHPMRARFVEREQAARARRAGLWAEVSVRDMPGWRQKSVGKGR